MTQGGGIPGARLDPTTLRACRHMCTCIQAGLKDCRRHSLLLNQKALYVGGLIKMHELNRGLYTPFHVSFCASDQQQEACVWAHTGRRSVNTVTQPPRELWSLKHNAVD